MRTERSFMKMYAVNLFNMSGERTKFPEKVQYLQNQLLTF